jgi:hypothetical protein
MESHGSRIGYFFEAIILHVMSPKRGASESGLGSTSGKGSTPMKDVTRIIAAFAIASASLLFASATPAQDPGWPRKLVKPGGIVLVYQPQVDDWQNFTEIKWRSAFQLTPNGGKQIVGAASFEATTEVNTDNHTVLIQYQCHEYVFSGAEPDSDAAARAGCRKRRQSCKTARRRDFPLD